MKLLSTSRTFSSFVVVLLLYPWLVSYDNVDSSYTQIKLGGGGIRSHTASSGCFPTPVYDDYGGPSNDVKVGAGDAGIEVMRVNPLLNYGVRANLFRTPDNGALFNSSGFEGADFSGRPHSTDFTLRNLWTLNPFVEVHGTSKKFSGHFALGVAMLSVPSIFTEYRFSLGTGLQVDSSFFANVSYLEGTPMISDGGLANLRIGLKLPHSLLNTILWSGVSMSAPFNTPMVLAKADIPLDSYSVAINALLGPRQYAIGSTLAIRF